MKHLAIYLSVAALFVFSQSVYSLTAGVWNDEYVGYEFVNGEFKGQSGSLYECAMKSSGYEIDPELIPVHRQMKLMQLGRLDIGIGWSHSDRKDQIASMTRPVTQIPVILVTGEAFRLDFFFNELILATINETGFKGFISNLNAEPHYVKTFLSAALMVYHGRVDGAVMPVNSLSSIDDERVSKLNHMVIGNLEMSFYVNKQLDDHKDVVNALNNGIKRCVASLK